MNATVERIVNLLFQDLKESDEVLTLHDEVMANCQERFEDSLLHGLSEDEAISAVVESLKGMEEVLRDYPRKDAEDAANTAAPDTQSQPAETVEEDEDEGLHLTYRPSEVDEICVNVMATDIRVCAGNDNLIHIDHVDSTGGSDLQGELKNNSLTINRKPMIDIDMEDIEKAAKKGMEINWSTISLSDIFSAASSFLNNLGNTINDSVNSIAHALDQAELVITVPRELALSYNLSTTSGDIHISNVPAMRLTAQTFSGDIEVETPAEHRMSHVLLKTTSGDIEGSFSAWEATVSNVSGDVDLAASLSEMSVHTVSGDATITGIIVSGEMKSVSGDLEIRPANTTRAEFTVNTTSGDVRIALPSPDTSVHADFVTTSGDAKIRALDRGENSDYQLVCHTVSGDLTIK